MKKSATAVITLAVLLTVSSSAFALDIRDGRIFLSLNEKTARFTVNYLVDAARNKYVPLLYDKEPGTTFPTLYWNDKTYRLGESSDFRFTVKKEGSNAVVEYRSSFASVREIFSLIRSAGSADFDGVLIEFTIENISSAAASAGLRLVWDTYLGENSKRHFELEQSGNVTGESVFSGVSLPRRVLSPGDSGASLQIQLAGEGLTKPDRFVLANWKRINDSGWSFEISPGRGFTLLPYSIEDSAAALYFSPGDLRPGAIRTIRTALGNRADSGYSTKLPLPGGSQAASASPSADPSGSGSLALTSDPFVQARTDIAALRNIVSRIDGLLLAGKSPSTEELSELRSLLDQIRTRKKDL